MRYLEKWIIISNLRGRKSKGTKKVEFNLNENSCESNKSVEEVEQQTPVVRRSGREKHQPERYSPPEYHYDFALTNIKGDPRLVEESIDSSEGKLWKKAIEYEMESLRKNET